MLPKYVIVTAAKNEAQYIELTIKSVLAQTVRPLKWVIVSDGSTDETDAIVSRYAAEHGWIELVRMPERAERHFAGKVQAFNSGYGQMSGLGFDVIVNLDADTSFGTDYFAFLLGHMAENPKLGIVSGRLVDVCSQQSYNFNFADIEYVSGPCQVFRRGCFEAIGGYRPLKSGGVDVVAVVSARAQGWRTRTFAERAYYHHRPMNGAKMKGLQERLHTGYKDYVLGNHPAWELFRSVYQMKHQPYLLGGICICVGYFSMLFRSAERTMPPELIKFRQKEQMQRLRNLLHRSIWTKAFLSEGYKLPGG